MGINLILNFYPFLNMRQSVYLALIGAASAIRISQTSHGTCTWTSTDGFSSAACDNSALARGELQCIGATTLDEYRKHIERDAALERRFQPVNVGEPSIDDTM